MLWPKDEEVKSVHCEVTKGTCLSILKSFVSIESKSTSPGIE